MIRGISNCSSATRVARISGASTPGRSTGRVTRKKVVSGRAPEALLASSSAGFMVRMAAPSSRKTNGTEAMPWHRISPGMLKMLIGPGVSRPITARSATFTHPALGANRSVQAKAMTMPGTRRGKRMAVKIGVRHGRSVRSISQARVNAVKKVTVTEPNTKVAVLGSTVESNGVVT